MGVKRNERLTFETDYDTIIFTTNRLVSNYWLNSVSGLDGLDNDIFTIRGAGQDGTTVIGHALQARTITVDGQVLTTASRQRLIRAVNPKHEAKLIYTDGTITRWIPCTVKRAPEIARGGIFPQFQIEFYCAYPYWREGDGSTQSVVDIAEWVPAFEFDSVDGLEVPEAGIEFETRSPSLIVKVTNNGDIEAGMLIEFRATGATSDPSIVNVETQEEISLTYDMQAGDIIRVCTIPRFKRAELTRGGVTTNIFNAVDAGSAWLQLDVGDNLLRYDATPTDNIEVSIYYDAAYLGV